MTNASPVILEVKNLAKHFHMHHMGRDLFAFDTLSFTLRAGEFVLLQGENGAGKSTLLRTLYRTYLPRGGQAIYHTKEGAIDLVSAAEVDIVLLRRREIGFVTQFLDARPRVSAEEVVAEPLHRAGREYRHAVEEARHWLSAFGVKRDLWEAYPSTFSGGEQQKVNLARALILPQKLLFLDEPTASLDASIREVLVARLAELKAAGVAMLGIFHHPEEVGELVDRTLYLGRKLA